MREVGFEAVPVTHSGILFTNALTPADAARNQILLNGSGVAAGDVDGDGRVDLFFGSLDGNNRLYRNLGDWRFEEIGETAGLRRPGRISTGVCFADVDGDGDLDLLVNFMGGGTALFRNQGGARFLEDAASGLLPRWGATSLALADIDGDGDLDLYTANYRTNTIRSTGFAVLNVNGQRRIRPEDRDRLEYLPDGRVLEHGEPDVLYLNDGQGRFSPVSWTGGRFLDREGRGLTRAPHDWTLSAAFRDLNGDGRVDLYVCGDFHSPDRVWIGDGKGGFREAGPSVIRQMPTFSMAVDFADLDRDGLDDFLVADMRDPRHEFRIRQSLGAMAIPGDFESATNCPQMGRNVLQWNRGAGIYSEVAGFAGLEATGWTWSVAFLDVDLDGYEDLLTATGHLFDTQDLDAQERIEANGPYRVDQIPGKLLQHPPLRDRKRAYRNRGGLRFEEASATWGWDDEAGVWQGLCLADLDGDGDLDVVVNRLNDAAVLYRNVSTAPRVLVRLKGLPPNTRGVGARIGLTGGPTPTQSQVIMAGGRYLSADDAARAFAARGDGGPMRLEVQWPGGRRSVLSDVVANHSYVIEEREATTVPGGQPGGAPRPEPFWFVDESPLLDHRHYETPFDDFERQPLLPVRGSRAGPGVAWIDLNGDRREDAWIGSGAGGRPGIYLNQGSGRFEVLQPDAVMRDQLGVVGSPGERGDTLALVAATPYESAEATVPAAGPAAALRAYNGEGVAQEFLSWSGATPGPLAMGDLDGDGDLDLLVGGGVIGGRYPEAGATRLWLREAGAWRAMPEADRVLAGVGLVRGAVLTDLDNDGFPELVLACEWGPVRVFQNARGRLREVTEEWGLAGWTGWWTGVEAADFDEDGRLDLVVGNWGLNGGHQPTPQHPLRLYYGDLAGRGQVDLIESDYDLACGQWVPERDLASMARQLPWIRAKFPTHQSYGRASVDDLLRHCAGPARVAEAAGLASMVFLNRGGRFEPHPLPIPAQISAVFGIAVADFDLDGHLDVFLAQNCFAVSPARSRQDAGLGLLLQGEGNGQFRALSAAQSGIAILGEQRGAAAGDYDGDGRPDLLVGQNGAETKLYRNVTSATGLRLELRGPEGNPRGIGAGVRMIPTSGVPGPLQEIHAGSGYGSQSGSTLCLPRPRGPVILEVRWPGGARTRHPLPAEATAGTVLLEAPPSSSSP